METRFPEVARADQGAAHSLYFDKFAKSYLLSALRLIISTASQATRHASTRSDSVLPYRLLRSVMDKPEIGDVIVSDILPDLSSCLKIQVESLGGIPLDRAISTKQNARGSKFTAKESASGKKSGKKSHKLELLQSANLFFNCLAPEQLWQWMEALLCRIIAAGVSGAINDSHTLMQSPARVRENEREGEGREDTLGSGSGSNEQLREVTVDSLPSSPVYPSSPELPGQHSGRRGSGEGGGGVQLSCSSACRLICFLLQILPLVT